MQSDKHFSMEIDKFSGMSYLRNLTVNQTMRTNLASLARLTMPCKLYCHSEKKLPFQKFGLETWDEFQSNQQAASTALQ